MQGGGFQTKPGGRLRQALNPTHAAGPSQERTGRGAGNEVLTAHGSDEFSQLIPAAECLHLKYTCTCILLSILIRPEGIRFQILVHFVCYINEKPL